MAKFIHEYTIHVGDVVEFTSPLGNGYMETRRGIVQDISQLPDVFVEGINNNGQYTRWRKGIDKLVVVASVNDEEPSGPTLSVNFEPDEVVEFVHNGGLDSPEFWRLMCRKVNESPNNFPHQFSLQQFELS